MHNFRIYGKKSGKKGGAFQGIAINDDDSREPIFGGANLMHAPVWWNTTKEKVETICAELRQRFPDCEFNPRQVN